MQGNGIDKRFRHTHAFGPVSKRETRGNRMKITKIICKGNVKVYKLENNGRHYSAHYVDGVMTRLTCSVVKRSSSKHKTDWEKYVNVNGPMAQRIAKIILDSY